MATPAPVDASSIVADLNWCCGRSQHRLRLGGISGLEDEDVTLTDTTLDVSTLNTLDGNTSGTIDASSVNFSPVLQKISTAPTTQAASQTLRTRTSPSPTPLSMHQHLDGNTSGTATPPELFTHTAYTANDNGSIWNSNEDLNPLRRLDASESISGPSMPAASAVTGRRRSQYCLHRQRQRLHLLSNEDVTLSGHLRWRQHPQHWPDSPKPSITYSILRTINDTILDASVLNTLDGNTSGTINANSINTLTGAADDLITALRRQGSPGLVMGMNRQR